MTDTNTEPAPRIFKIPLKSGAAIDVPASEVSGFNDDVYNEIIVLGLKALLNRGMDKAVGPVKDLEGDKLAEAKSAAVAQAQKNLENLKSGNVKTTKAKSEKTTGAVNVEAMRLARNIVKDAMKRAKIKVSYVPAADITRMAKAYLETNPELIAQAKASNEAYEKQASSAPDALASLVKTAKVSDKLVKAAEEKKEKDKAERALSAKQAGKTVPHKKGKAPQATNPQATA